MDSTSNSIASNLFDSPSTLSLYMNCIPRVHGWKDLERKLITWIKTLKEDEEAENKDEQDSHSDEFEELSSKS
jgi:hypothetical protein